MHVRYQRIDPPDQEWVPLTRSQMSNYLVEDWLPGGHPVAHTDLFGWLTGVIEERTTPEGTYWTVARRLHSTERQWKGVVSWMLGIIGARFLMADEGYRWIAPVSAFYGGAAAEPVTIGDWPTDLPPSSLVADGNPSVDAELRPDYLAIRRPNPG